MVELLEAPDHAEHVVDRLTEYAVSMTGSDQAALILVRPDSDDAVVVASVGAPEAAPGRELGDTWAERLSTGAPLLLTASTATVAVVVGDECRGALEIARSGDAYASDELAVLTELADLVGLVIQHDELPGSVRQRIQHETSELADALEARLGYDVDKATEVATAVAVAEGLDLDPGTVVDVELAIRVHDVGIVGVPQEILDKPAPLTDEERRVVDQIPVWSAESLARVPGLEAVAMTVLHCRDRFDSTGGTDGLAGDRTPVVSRIVDVCSAYRSMLSNRPFRPAMTPDVALAELRELAGARYDRAVVDALAKVAGASLVEHPE